jgi:O-antigen/teichoic acid export membrane protein
MENLRSKLVSLTFFSFLNEIVGRGLGIISTIIIIHFLSRADFGLIGITLGYLSVFNFIALAPETILLRDYQQLKLKIIPYLQSFLGFAGVRLILMLLGWSIFVGLYHDQSHSTMIIWLLLVHIVCLNFELVSNITKELLFVEFKQALIMRLDVISKVIQIACLSGLYFYPAIEGYMLVFLLGSGLRFLLWQWVLIKKYGSIIFTEIHHNSRKKTSMLLESIKSFSLWQHLNGVGTNILYNIDTVILSLLAISLATIGNYSVALQLSNFFFLVPMIIQKSVMVSLANSSGAEQDNRILSEFIRYSILISALQLALFYFFGAWAIRTFITTIDSDEIFRFTLIILCGITILNICRPLVAYAVSRTDVAKLLYVVTIPAVTLGIAMFLSWGYYFGVHGVALANIFNYGLYAFMIWCFIRWNQKKVLLIRIKLITSLEKQLLMRMWSYLRKRGNGQ